MQSSGQITWAPCAVERGVRASRGSGFNPSLGPVKAKFHYAIYGSKLVRSWLEAGSKLVADRFEAGSNLSASSFEPVCDQDSVIEFGFEPVCDHLRAGSRYLDMSR